MTLLHLLLLLLCASRRSAAPTAAAAPRDGHCALNVDVAAQIRRDLEPWRLTGVPVDALHRIGKLCQPGDIYHSCNSYLKLSVQDGVLYMNSLTDRGENMQPHWELPGQLLELYEASVHHRLPDCDFVLFFGDELPLEALRLGLPLFALWKGAAHSAVVTVPNSGSYRCTRDGVDLLLGRLPEIDKVPWKERAPVALARHALACPHWLRDNGGARFPGGEPIPCPRKRLDNLSSTHPDLLDSCNLLEHLQRRIPLMEQTKYRYLVSTDGWSCTNKLDKFLMMGSVVLKQDSQRYGWYYSAMKPMQHYVPIFANHSDDTLEAVRWLRANDDKAKEIAQAGRQLVQSVLTRPARLCYWKTLLEHYAKLLRYKPSCKLRSMCVPALDELRYLGHYDKAPQEEGCCIHAQLGAILGKAFDPGLPVSKSYGGPNTTFGHPGWVFHEPNHTLQQYETIQGWKPPW